MRVAFVIILTVIFAFCGEIKIATYNVENLFDSKNNGNEYGDFVLGKSEWSQSRAEQKFQLIKEQIKAINADIIALQEIENEDILKRLMSESGYKFFVFSKGKNAPVGLGLLSRIKPIKSEFFAVPNVKTRDVVRSDFMLGEMKFSLFNLHFPSRKNSLKQRKTAFLTLKAAIENEKNNIILGDFNTPINDKDGLLQDLLTSKWLENLWQNVAIEERYSHINAQAIDQILLSKGIFANATEFKVWRDESGKISDHFALSFVLKTDPQSLNQIDINALYETNPKLPAVVKNAVVVHKNRLGFTINDGSRGIYVYEPKNTFKLGDSADFVVTGIKDHNQNLEISSYYIANHNPKQDKNKFIINNLSILKAGDVFGGVNAKVRSKMLVGDFGEIKFYDKKNKLKEGQTVFLEAVRVQKYNGKLQLVIEDD